MPDQQAMTFQRLGGPSPAHQATGNPLYDNKWKLVEPNLEGPENGIILTMAQDSVCVKVANNLRVGATVGDDGTIVKSGPMIATRMMAPESLQPAEKQMSDMLESINGWKLEGNVLTITSGDGTYKWSMAPHDHPVCAKPLMVAL